MLPTLQKPEYARCMLFLPTFAGLFNDVEVDFVLICHKVSPEECHQTTMRIDLMSSVNKQLAAQWIALLMYIPVPSGLLSDQQRPHQAAQVPQRPLGISIVSDLTQA